MYDKVKETLYTYIKSVQLRMDLLARKPGERWMGCGWRLLNLISKWTEHCETVKDIRNLIAAEKMVWLMPRQIATRVRKRKPILEEAAQWADDYWGWPWMGLSSHSKQSQG